MLGQPKAPTHDPKAMTQASQPGAATIHGSGCFLVVVVVVVVVVVAVVIVMVVGGGSGGSSSTLRGAM